MIRGCILKLWLVANESTAISSTYLIIFEMISRILNLSRLSFRLGRFNEIGMSKVLSILFILIVIISNGIARMMISCFDDGTVRMAISVSQIVR